MVYAPAMRRIVPLVALALVAGCGVSSTPSTPKTAAPDSSSASSTSTSSPSKAATPAGTVLLTIAGSGTKSTQKFTTGSDWDLAWTYDCKAFGASGNFIVSPTASDPMTLVSPVNQLGASGASVEHYHDGGTFYLDINSECAWTVKVTTA